MFGKFENNKLHLLLVKGNAESVYFNRNEDTQVLETITKEISSNIEFTLNKGQIETVKYLKKSDGNTYPPSQLPDDVRQLKGFIWREDEQPKKMQDKFIKDDKKKVPPKKGDKKNKSAIIDKKKKSKADLKLMKTPISPKKQ
jgi:hypothetical protein